MPVVVSDLIEVCIFRLAREVPEVLLLRRAPRETLYPGIWQIVTGSIHDGETAVDAARRELAEETGLLPSGFWVVPWTTSFYEPGRDLLHVIPFFAAQVPPGAEVILSEEHDQALWLPFPEGELRLIWPGQRQGLEMVRRYIVEGEAAAGWSEILSPSP
jgi:8-oxo-dGTP pyrophosphatase MutT (NUDIX family)